MGKSSSIVKRTRHKSSSKTGSRKKSRSKEVKSRKIRRCDRSISFSDNDEYRSLSSVLYSSSENDYRRSRRSRSPSRKETKSVKKSSHSRGKSPRSRKRKKLKRKGDSDVGKKNNLKKKRKKKVRRDASVSSSRSRSRSCSTCHGKSHSDDKSEFNSDGDRYGMKKNDVKRGIKRGRYRPKSLSSCSHHSENNDYHQHGEEVMHEKIPGRLKSVIVVRQEEEGGELNEDEHKEEMVYDRDDDPPCRSNDSNDGGSKRELSHQSHLPSEKRRRLEIEKEEAVVSNIRTSKLIESGKDGGSNLSSDGVAKKDHVKKDTAGSDVSEDPDCNDLESILRQRALENLKSFRGVHQRNARSPIQKDTNVSALKQASSENAELVQINSVKEDGAKMVDKTEAVEVRDPTSLRERALENLKLFREGLQMNAKCSATQQDTNDSAEKQPSTRKVGSVHHKSPMEGGVILGGKAQIVECINFPVPVARRSTSSEQNDKKVPFQSDADSGSYSSNQDASITTRPKSAITELSHNSSTNESTLNNAPASNRPPKANLSVRAIEKGNPGFPQTEIQSSNNKEELSNAGGSLPEPSPSPKPTSRSFSSNKQQDEGKDDSQYEQKTMSVMRGGEMVQVSYKVYIPKKTPALARRQLKR